MSRAMRRRGKAAPGRGAPSGATGRRAKSYGGVALRATPGRFRGLPWRTTVIWTLRGGQDALLARLRAERLRLARPAGLVPAELLPDRGGHALDGALARPEPPPARGGPEGGGGAPG